MHLDRDGLAHKASAFLAFEKDESVVFEKRKPFDDRDPARKKECAAAMPSSAYTIFLVGNL
jgi:hypothetical protein